MYAILENGGKQYRVRQGDVVSLESIPAQAGSSVTFSEVLAVGQEGQLIIGKPYVENATVSGRIVGHGKAKKIVVFKYKAKKNYRRKQGHRQPFTRVIIESIALD